MNQKQVLIHSPCPVRLFPRPLHVDEWICLPGEAEQPSLGNACLYLVTTGTWRPLLDDLEQELQTGQALLRESDAGPLHFRILDEPCRLLGFHFDGADATLADIIACCGDVVRLPLSSQAGRLLQGLITCEQEQLRPGLAEAARIVTSVLAGVIDHNAGPRRSPHSALMCRILERLDQAATEGAISLRHIAQEMNISVEHLSRSVREATGRTPLQYLTRGRIRHACLLLRTTDRAVADIAQQLGYRDSSYFAEVFRRLTGYRPSHYRESLSAPPL